MQIVAAKAVAFREAGLATFVDYQRAVIANAQRMADTLMDRGVKVWTGGTDSHMLMVDLAASNLDGAAGELALERAGITVNRIRIPGAYEEAPSGLRLGTPAITTRGMGTEEAALIANWIADLIEQSGSEAVIARLAEDTRALAAEFPVYT